MPRMSLSAPHSIFILSHLNFPQHQLELSVTVEATIDLVAPASVRTIINNCSLLLFMFLNDNLILQILKFYIVKYGCFTVDAQVGNQLPQKGGMNSQKS